MGIVGGNPESGYPAVGALVDNGQPFCSGTLVAPTTVVTAAHCLQGESATGKAFFIGTDANNPATGESFPATSLHVHPQYNEMTMENDIAIMELSQPASSTPIPYACAALTQADAGAVVLMVGYGVTAENNTDVGIKRSVEVRISEVLPTQWAYTVEATPAGTCYGDSGGPGLREIGGIWTLIGATSYGTGECEAVGTRGYSTQVGAFADFVDTYAGLCGGGGGGGGGDPCEENGWYGDGICDDFCPLPDPDCGGGGGGGDICEENGWYGDGICDPFCLMPDPDCGGGGGGGDDFCEANGWYGDGICDPFCPMPDPDCGGGGGTGDFCADNGWYGDGICDWDCPLPDPDCF